MRKLLIYAATTAVALLASPFIIASVALIFALVLFVAVAIAGTVAVTVTFFIPLALAALVIGAAAWLLFKLLD